jgi:hypothetical protein
MLLYFAMLTSAPLFLWQAELLCETANSWTKLPPAFCSIKALKHCMQQANAHSCLAFGRFVGDLCKTKGPVALRLLPWRRFRSVPQGLYSAGKIPSRKMITDKEAAARRKKVEERPQPQGGSPKE